MFIRHEVFIGLRDVGIGNKVTNTALLSYFEDAGGVHSSLVGYGLNDIPTVKRSWVLIGWKIKIDKRPKYGDKITIKTWSRGIDKLYAYRDYEVLDENGNILGIATSKWVLVDTEKKRVTKIDEQVQNAYSVENICVFDELDLEKLSEPDAYTRSTTFTVNRSLIDVNDHLHNIYFMDIANEVLPMDVYKKAEFNDIRIMCKKEIKLGDTVKVFYCVKDDEHIVTIKSQDEKNLHAIIILR